MHGSSAPNRAANASSPAIRSSPKLDRDMLPRGETRPEHLANLSYLDRGYSIEQFQIALREELNTSSFSV
jgi:hypothetical protein